MEAGSDELALVVPPTHRLAGKESVGISELGLENFVAHNAASPYRDQVIAEFERKKVDLNIGIEMPSLEAIKRLVERGLGVALIPKIIAENEVRAGKPLGAFGKGMRLVRKLHIVYRRNCVLSHAAEAFLDLARRIQ